MTETEGRWVRTPRPARGRGLRERKRRDLRRRLREAAGAQIRAEGPEALRVGEVADAVQVSEATVYNHFRSRGGLARAWLRGELGALWAEVLDHGAGASLRPRGRTLARRLAAWVDAERVVVAALWSPAGAGAPVEASDDGPEPRQAATRFFAEGQERGEVRADVPPERLAGLLVAGVDDALSAAVQRDDDAVGLQAALQSAIEVVLDGSRKRHERVRAAARSRPLAPPRP